MTGFQELAGLYRSILRVHRNKLPGPMRALGDSYAAEEFRRHLKAKTTPQQWQEFGRQWQQYVDMLTGQAQVDDRSGYPADDLLGALTPEQMEQMAALQQAAEDLGRTIKAQMAEEQQQPPWGLHPLDGPPGTSGSRQ
jgi:hypothetical protein